MVQAPRLFGMALGAALALGGCASESNFRPWDHGDDDGDPGSGQDDPDGPGTGGWGDWDLGEIPSIAIVMSTWATDSATGTELVVVDLRGQILDTWQPPYDAEYGWYPTVTQIEPLGQGKVMVVTSLGWDRFDQQSGTDSSDSEGGSTGFSSGKNEEIPEKLYGGWGSDWQAG